MRVALDVNVLASAFPRQRGIPRQVVDQWLTGAYEVVASEHVLNGVQRAWDKPYFHRTFPRPLAAEALFIIRSLAVTVVPVDGIHGVADHEEDDLVLATAEAGQADYLVTGDNGLLRLGSFRNVRIISPRDFLSLLDSSPRFSPT